MAALLNVSCGFKRKKYDNPITKDTQQPDKVLFDKAIKDIEHGHYEVARLTLNTLINTYDTSEYLAKAKLAIADSWYREGGIARLGAGGGRIQGFHPVLSDHGRGRRVAGKDLQDPLRADGQGRSRPNNALRAEQECRTLITQFPNSKYVPEADAAAARDPGSAGGSGIRHRRVSITSAVRTPRRPIVITALVDQYPLYSQADEALWEEADSYAAWVLASGRWRARHCNNWCGNIL